MENIKMWLIRILRPVILERLRKLLNQQHIRQLVVKLINSKLDIPNLSEADEAKLIDRMYLAFIEAFNKVMENI